MNLDGIIENLPSKKTPLNKNTFEKMANAILDKVYPIGRGFIDFTDTDYSNYLGFTWERELVGLTPIGYDPNDNDFDEIGKTGGSKTHRHDFKIGMLINWSEIIIQNFDNQGAWSYSQKKYTKSSGVETETFNTRMNTGHTTASNEFNNVKTSYSIGDTDTASSFSPYKVVAYWKRTA